MIVTMIYMFRNVYILNRKVKYMRPQECSSLTHRSHRALSTATESNLMILYINPSMLYAYVSTSSVIYISTGRKTACFTWNAWLIITLLLPFDLHINAPDECDLKFGAKFWWEKVVCQRATKSSQHIKFFQKLSA